ncbi:MAG TPA: lipoyl synthase [Anaerovoracaceae bacterium]|nr:lipoyl synthase [Anaerovoracaceae bacterium]
MNVNRPDWLKIKYAGSGQSGRFEEIAEMIKSLQLHTVCEEANCPNALECFSKQTATFMILGNVCSRNCRFCNVTGGKPLPVDPQEPANVAEAARKLGLKYVVVTSVTRDDLPDGGASQFAKVIHALKEISDDIAVEVLTPDFQGDIDALSAVVNAKPKVINHNVETIERLYPLVRPEANYKRSLEFISRVKKLDPDIFSKSGFMVGLGETKDEVEKLLRDLCEHGCDIVTIGQYLQPTAQHYPVQEYVHPDVFRMYKEMGLEMGFRFIASAPFVRSSYQAGEAFA